MYLYRYDETDRHVFTTRLVLNDYDATLYIERSAILWCREHLPDSAWDHNIWDIIIPDDNHAMAFRMRWC